MPSENVAIFWDYENCSSPSNVSGYDAVKKIRSVAHSFGTVKLFKAYLQLSEAPASSRTLLLRSELQASGVSLTDCPHNGRKEVADKMMLVDMLAYAIDTPAPAYIILISGDRDFAYAVSTLRLRRYHVVVISAGEVPVHPSLKSQASVFLDWHSDVLAEVVDEGPCFRSRGNEDVGPLATSVPSRRYTRTPLPFSSARSHFSSEDAEIDIDHSQNLYDVHKSQYLGGPARLSKEVKNASSHPSSPDSPVVEAESSTPSLRAPSRTESAPAASLYSRSEFPVTSTAFGNYPNVVNDNISAPETLPSGPPTPTSKGFTSFLPSPQMKKGTVDLMNVHTTVGRLPSAILEHTVFPIPHQPTPVQASTPHIPVSRSLEHVTPAMPVPVTVTSLKERLTGTVPVQPNKSVPLGFEPLVQNLERYRSRGVTRPFRSKVATELATPANTMYRQVGAERFGQYADMAVKAGLIELGGREGGAWIALRPEWYDAKQA